MLQVNLENKKKIIEQCLSDLGQKLLLCKNSMNDIKEGISNETKSSAGDKFETAREMMQQEFAKLQEQIQRIMQIQDFLQMVKHRQSEKVQAGSFIKSGSNYLLFVPGFAAIEFQKYKIDTVAINSPLGQSLLGLQKGECSTFKEKQYCVEMIV